MDLSANKQPQIHTASAQASRTRSRQKQQATAVGALVNLPLAAVKIIAGIFGHSQALIADGIHSAADLLSDALVLAAVRAGGQSADHDHPYGHARMETAATALVSLLLLLTAAAVGYDGITHLINSGQAARPTWLALAIALASLGLKEGLFWYTLKVAQAAQSQLIEANAWHHRSDALASIAALAAIIGAMLGFPVADGLGALVIAVMLAVIGLRYARASFRELVDTGLKPDRLDVVREQIATVPGVRRMRRLRTRTMGGHDAFADVGVFVDPYISLTEAHRISEAISTRLVHRVDEIADICVHVEPDGHADADAAHALPLREQVLPKLERGWAHLAPAPAIRRVTLHYVEDFIEVDVFLPLVYDADDARWQQAFNAIAADIDGVTHIRLFYTSAALSDDKTDKTPVREEKTNPQMNPNKCEYKE